MRFGASHRGHIGTRRSLHIGCRNAASHIVSFGDVYLYDLTCAHRTADARACGRPGFFSAQHGEMVHMTSARAWRRARRPREGD
eukprot:29239-Pelagococcus_subviridis.AAC.5